MSLSGPCRIFRRNVAGASVGCVAILLAGPVEVAAASELVVYSARKEELIRPAIQAAEKALALRVTLFTAGAGELARRIELEKGNPRGDVFIGTTAGFAELMRDRGLLDAFASPLLKEVPAEFRAEVKIRYTAREAQARVEPVGEDQAHVRFDAPQRDITARQAAVFFQGDLLLGGGLIQ